MNVTSILIAIYLMIGAVWSQYSLQWAMRTFVKVSQLGPIAISLIVILETIGWPLAAFGHFYIRRKLKI